jgi:hypothetical protein
MTKRLRGRPKGTKKLPPEYRDLLLDLGSYRLRDGESLSAMCRNICKNGGIQFVYDDGNVVAQITKWRTLHTRLTEAMGFMPRAEHEKDWKLDRKKNNTDGPFRIGFGIYDKRVWICVPARTKAAAAAARARAPIVTTSMRGFAVVEDPSLLDLELLGPFIPLAAKRAALCRALRAGVNPFKEKAFSQAELKAIGDALARHDAIRAGKAPFKGLVAVRTYTNNFRDSLKIILHK